MNMGSIRVLVVLVAVASVTYGAPIQSDAKGEE